MKLWPKEPVPPVTKTVWLDRDALTVFLSKDGIADGDAALSARFAGRARPGRHSSNRRLPRTVASGPSTVEAVRTPASATG